MVSKIIVVVLMIFSLLIIIAVFGIIAVLLIEFNDKYSESLFDNLEEKEERK
jgi:hypothetical protein